MTLLAGIGAGLHVGGGSSSDGDDKHETYVPILDFGADAIIAGMVDSVLVEYSKKFGFQMELVGLVSAGVYVGPKGKKYRLTIKVKVYINGIWVIKIFNVIVWVPWMGPWGFEFSELYEAGAE